MKRLLLAAIVAMAASASAWAQSSTGIGVGRSTSRSQAISGQGGTGVGLASITSNSTVPADQTVKNVPSVVAPGLAAAGLETCLGSISGGGAFLGTGISFGSTIPDPGCAARLDSRTLWSMGLKKAAVARLCLNSDVYRAMPEVCDRYLPASASGYPTVGDIWLVDGATGKNRLCNNYDVTQQRCRVWAHSVHPSAPKKKAASGETFRARWTGGFAAMERCTKSDDEPGLFQKASLLCGKFFPLRASDLPPYGQSVAGLVE